MCLCFLQRMRHCLTIRGGESMTSLAMAHHQGRAMEMEEEEEEAPTTSNSTTSPSTLTTFSKNITSIISSNTSTRTPSLKTKNTRRDTLTATSRPTARPWTGTTDSSSSRRPSARDSSMTCLRTWRRCSPSTTKAPGLTADSRARGSSTAGQWRSAGGTWWPPTPTAPEASRTRRAHTRQPFRTLLGFYLWFFELIGNLSLGGIENGFVWLFLCNFLYVRNKYPSLPGERLLPSNNFLTWLREQVLVSLRYLPII